MTVAGTLGDNPIQNTILFFVCQGTWALCSACEAPDLTGCPQLTVTSFRGLPSPLTPRRPRSCSRCYVLKLSSPSTSFTHYTTLDFETGLLNTPDSHEAQPKRVE